MEYFLKDSYHTLLCRLGFIGSACPVYYSPSASPFSFWEAMVFHRAITFFNFALLNLSIFSSNPLVGGNFPKVSEMKENFTGNMNFHSSYCSLKFLKVMLHETIRNDDL